MQHHVDLMIWCFFLGFKHKKQTMWCHHQSLSISAILAASFHWSRSLYLEAILRSLRFAHFTVGATTTSSTPIPRRPARFSCGQNWRHWTFATCVTLLDFRPTRLVVYVMVFYGPQWYFYGDGSSCHLLSSLIHPYWVYPMDWLVHQSTLPLWTSQYCRCWKQ